MAPPKEGGAVDWLLIGQEQLRNTHTTSTLREGVLSVLFLEKYPLIVSLTIHELAMTKESLELSSQTHVGIAMKTRERLHKPSTT